jgi:hypothetical protein
MPASDPADRELDFGQARCGGRLVGVDLAASSDRAGRKIMSSVSSGSQSERFPDWAALRISDSDRDQISGVLSEHAAEGRLTMDELDQRIGALYAAKTRAQAAAVVADLPALPAAHAPHSVHAGHEPESPAPALPEWLTVRRLADSSPAEPHSTQTPADRSTGTPIPARKDRAAGRRRAKLRQDENAIGHTFQATRRAINAKLATARASGRSGDVQRLEERLQDAHKTADSARQAVTAGDRAEVQRLLASLRALA